MAKEMEPYAWEDLFLILLNDLNEEKEVEPTGGKTLEPTGKPWNPRQNWVCEVWRARGAGGVPGLTPNRHAVGCHGPLPQETAGRCNSSRPRALRGVRVRESGSRRRALAATRDSDADASTADTRVG